MQTKKGSSVFNHISGCVNYQHAIKILYCIYNNSFDAYTYGKNSIQKNKKLLIKLRTGTHY